MTELFRRICRIIPNLFLVYSAIAALGGIVFIYVAALYVHPLFTLSASAAFLLGMFARGILHFFGTHIHVDRVLGGVMPH